jgi:hypothetical protein
MRAAKTKKGIDRQLKRDHIAKVNADIKWHLEWNPKEQDYEMVGEWVFN